VTDHLLTTSVPSFAMAWKALLLDHRVSDGAVRMYLVLATYTRPDRPVAFPGQDTLAAQMNCSVDTVQRRGTELAQTGWIVKVRRGRGRSNVYHLRMPAPLRIDVDQPDPQPVEQMGTTNPDTADVRLLDTAVLRLPYEEEQGEVQVTPPTPRKRGARRARDHSPLTEAERADDFRTWYAAYPRKTGPIDAERAWRQMLDRLPTLDALLAATMATSERVAREHPDTDEWKRYTPHAATWLRRGDFLSATADAARLARPRPPCVACGVPEPSTDVCKGVMLGILNDLEACPWNN
jgi:hypothetical protein